MNRKHFNAFVALVTIGFIATKVTSTFATPLTRSAAADPYFLKLPNVSEEPKNCLAREQLVAPGKRQQTATFHPRITPAPAWIKQLGTTDCDITSGVSVDKAGNTYITGYTFGKLGDQYYGKTDAWLAKYNSTGQLLWIKQLGTARWDYSNGVATDVTGNIYVTGWTKGKLGDQQYGSTDVWVAKYSSSGDLLWTRQLGTTDYDFSNGVAADGAGNVYIAGETEGQLGNQQYGDDDAWVAKYSPSGTLLWTQQIGSDEEDIAYSITADAKGSVYIAGATTGKLGDQQYGRYDAWIAKYSSAGTQKWIKQLGSPKYDYTYGVVADGTGHVYMTGTTRGKLGDQQYGISPDAWVAKYSIAGRLQWTKQLGSGGDDISYGIAADAKGNVYIAGATTGKLGDQQYGRYDAWVSRYSPTGALQWIRQLGTRTDNFASSVAADVKGNVYVTGYTEESLLGNQQYGRVDAWVAKYSP